VVVLVLSNYPVCLVGPPMLDRSKVKTQTKRNTLFPQVGVGSGAEDPPVYKTWNCHETSKRWSRRVYWTKEKESVKINKWQLCQRICL